MSFPPPPAPYQPPPPAPARPRRARKIAVLAGGVALGLLMVFAVLGAILGAPKKTPGTATARTTSPVAAVTTPASALAHHTGPAPSRPPQSATTAPRASTVLTGFGATHAQWAAHHTPDPANGAAAWDPDPALPATGGGVTDTYQGVTFTGNPARALGYFVTFTARDLAAAEQRAARELPADAVVTGAARVDLHGVAGAQCVAVTFTSATLAAVLGPADGGQVVVVFQSQQYNHLDTSTLVQATVESAAHAGPTAC